MGSGVVGVISHLASALGDIFDALVSAAFSSPPVGLLLLTVVILAASALPEDKREKARMAALAAIGLIVLVKIFWL
jgi:hypothetical protein